MKRAYSYFPYSIYNDDGLGSRVTQYGFKDDVLLASEGHPRVNGVYQSGGPFYVRHREFRMEFVDIDWTLNGVRRRFSPRIGVATGSPTPLLTRSDLESQRLTNNANAAAFGSTAWKRTRPGNPVASVATLIGESREFLPSLPKRLYDAIGALIARKQSYRRLHGPKGLGDAYLNVQFGWLPLVSDIQKMYELYQTLDKRLADIVRNNDKGVRRRTKLRDSTDSTVTRWESTAPFANWHGGVPPTWVPGRSVVEQIDTVTDKIWYVARYHYYIPDIGSSQWTKRATRALYGANFTPEVAWNLLPWTWLFDWFGNVGDVVSNISSNAVDNLTADYAYLMRTQETRTDYMGYCRWDGARNVVTNTSITAGSATCVGVTKTVTKLRIAASPFGFGVTFDGLTPYQTGIAAALGISRWAS